MTTNTTDTVEAIYERINDLRDLVLRAAYDGGQLSDEVPWPVHLMSKGGVDASDWTAPDKIFGWWTLGDPNADWCVTIDEEDWVTVWAAGDEVAKVLIPGAVQIIPTVTDDDAQAHAGNIAADIAMVMTTHGMPAYPSQVSRDETEVVIERSGVTHVLRVTNDPAGAFAEVGIREGGQTYWNDDTASVEVAVAQMVAPWGVRHLHRDLAQAIAGEE